MIWGSTAVGSSSGRSTPILLAHVLGGGGGGVIKPSGDGHRIWCLAGQAGV